MAIPDTQVRSKVFSTISRLSRSCQYLPRSYWVNPNTIELPSIPHKAGGYADVYLGLQGGKPVAVKVLRASGQESTEQLKKVSADGQRKAKHVETADLTTRKQRFCREAIVWKHVSSTYVLKFKGAFYHSDVPAIVMPWMPHGNITEYLAKHPDVDRLRLVSSNTPKSQTVVHP